jgi:hypothetical protein
VRYLLTSPALTNAGMTLVRPTLAGDASTVPEALRSLLRA